MNKFVLFGNILSALIVTAAAAYLNPINVYKSYEVTTQPEPLKTQDIIRKHGYPVETHYVKTTDGWNLELHRIPRSKNALVKPSKVVFMPHCFLCCSSVYVILGAEKALGFKLSDNGYDVWMMNSRGNSYSSNHTSLSKKQFPYWDFSWHEMGMLDVPLSLNYVLEHTGAKKVDVVGFSMAAASTFVMLSKMPDYNEKIRAMAFMAPGVFIQHASSPILKMMAPIRGFLVQMFRTMRWFSLPQNEWSVNTVIAGLCDVNKGFLAEMLCDQFLFLVLGSRSNGIPRELFKNMLLTFPDVSSSQTAAHYGQVFASGNFREHDHGPMSNYVHYGHWKPEKYNLSKITVPVALVSSTGDKLVPDVDVDYLATKLKDVTMLPKIKDDEFGHMHFVWCQNSDVLAYNPIINYLNNLPHKF